MISTKDEIASATDHLLKIKFYHVPRNDAAVVRFALAGIGNEEAMLMFVL